MPQRGSAIGLRDARQRVDLGLGLGRLLLGHRDDLGRLGDVRLVVDHELHERLDLGPLRAPCRTGT